MDRNQGPQMVSMAQHQIGDNGYELTEPTCNRRLILEEIVSGVSARFINHPIEHFDANVDEVLETLGEFLNASGAFIFLYDTDLNALSCKYEWCAVSHHINRKPQILLLDQFPWLKRKLNARSIISAQDINEFPEEAHAEYRLLAECQIQSILVIPLPRAKNSLGFMGFYTREHTLNWLSDDTHLLRIVAEIIVNTRQRKATEEALRESETRFRTLFENSADAVLLIEEEKITHCNQAALHLLGVTTREQILGRAPWDFSPTLQPTDNKPASKMRELMAEALRNGSCRFEWTSMRGDTIIPLEVVFTVMQMQGRMVFHTVWRNIMERKQAQVELEQYRDLLEKLVTQRTTQLVTARKHVEAILNNSVDGIVLAYFNSTINQTNFAFNTIFGCEPDDYFGQSLVSLAYQDDSQRLADLIERVIQQKKGDHIEIRALKRDGTILNVEFGIGFISKTDDEEAQLVCGIRDITKRKRMEEALRQSEERYRSVVDHIKEVIFQTDADGLWSFLNPAWHEMTGFSVEESIGQPFFDYVHPDDRQRNRDLFEPLIKREKSYCRHEVRYLTHNGSFRWVEVLARLTLDDQDQIIGTSGTLMDITERKLSEAALHASEKRYRSLFEQTNDGVFYIDLEGKHIAVNQRASELLGYSQESLIGLSYKDIVVPLEYLESDDNLERLLKGEKLPIYERTFRRKDGAQFPVEINAQLVYDSEDQPMYIQSVARDISERKEAETALLQALEKEKELGDLKSRFVSMVSHEFRTPLATIQATADTLRYYIHKMDETQVASRFNKIQAQVKHMTMLLEDVLTFGRIQSGRLELNPVQTPLDQFFKETLDDIRAAAEKDNQIIYTITPEDLEIEVDQKLLRQMITNLLTNAIKYTPDEKPIQFNVLKKDQYVVLEVADSGVGIPEEDQHRMFEAFFRATNVNHISGTGLGLVVVKNSVEMHGGTIMFASKEGVGTTFTVTLPCDQREGEVL